MRGSCRSACFASFAKQMTWAIFQIGWRTAGREAAMVGGGGGLILVLQFVAGAALSEVACPGEAGVRGGWRFAPGPLSLSPPAVRRMSFRSARTINSMKSGGFMKRGGHCFASCRPSSCATCTARTRCAISHPYQLRRLRHASHARRRYRKFTNAPLYFTCNAWSLRGTDLQARFAPQLLRPVRTRSYTTRRKACGSPPDRVATLSLTWALGQRGVPCQAC